MLVNWSTQDSTSIPFARQTRTEFDAKDPLPLGSNRGLEVGLEAIWRPKVAINIFVTAPGEGEEEKSGEACR